MVLSIHALCVAGSDTGSEAPGAENGPLGQPPAVEHPAVAVRPAIQVVPKRHQDHICGRNGNLQALPHPMSRLYF
eukprot:scaffold316773_cov47-Prasinocladus_malaysianus.AAC.1